MSQKVFCQRTVHIIESFVTHKQGYESRSIGQSNAPQNSDISAYQNTSHLRIPDYLPTEGGSGDEDDLVPGNYFIFIDLFQIKIRFRPQVTTA